MLGQGQKFDMRKAVLLEVGDELVGDLVVAVPAVFVCGVAPPGTEVQLVDVQRRIRRGGARGHPVRVGEGILIRVGDDRAAARPQLHRKAIGVAVLDDRAARGINAVLVELPRPRIRDCHLPESTPAVLF